MTVVSDEIPETSAPTIELSDKRQIKKSSKTLLLSAVALVDLQVICISSVCSDLRFYDVSSASKCNLRFYIRNFPYPLTTFHYHCSTDDKNSKLIFGDMAGSVRVIYFAKSFRSMYREGSVIRQLSYLELMKVTEDWFAESLMASMKSSHWIVLGQKWSACLHGVHQNPPRCCSSSVVHRELEQFHLIIWKHYLKKCLSPKYHNWQSWCPRLSYSLQNEPCKWNLIGNFNDGILQFTSNFLLTGHDLLRFWWKF